MDIEGMQFTDVVDGMRYSCDIQRLVKGTNAVNRRPLVIYKHVLCSVSASRESVTNAENFQSIQWIITLRLRPGQELRRGDKIINIIDTRTGQRANWEEMSAIFVEYLDSFTYQAVCNEGI